MKIKLITFLVTTIILLAALLPASAERSVRRTAAPVPSANRYGLVIGNGAYATSPLENPVNDATDVASALKVSGFQVMLLKNGNRKEMKRAIEEFGQNLRNGGVGLFYFSGHGIQVDGHNYLVPIGADLQSESDVEYDAIDAGRVLGKMEDAGNDVNIVILDACRTNPFARSFRSGSKGLAQMDAPTGSIVAYATSPGSVASDGKGRNGVYTKYLLQQMLEQGLTIEQVFKRVRQSVLSETGKKQTPWESSSLIGNFYFRGSGAAQASAASPVPNHISDGEMAMWELLQSSTQIADVQLFLDSYPQGRYQGAARLKMAQLERLRVQASLTVRPTPRSSAIRILNIGPVYTAGMKLAPGRYHLEVSSEGYETKTDWLDLPIGEQVEHVVSLTKLKSPAEKLYDKGLGEYRAETYKDAIASFILLLEQNPKHELVANAKYWLGISRLKNGDYSGAVLEFQHIIADYPQHPNAPKALLRQAEAFGHFGDKKVQGKLYKDVINYYPNSEQAKVAKEKLQHL
jgi:tol-pal system protein YbgF